MQNDSASRELYASPEVPNESAVRSLFADQDNSGIMQQLVAEPGAPYLAETIAAHYLRPSYTNGSLPPDTISPEDPLYAQIVEIDLDTVQDPVQKHVFGLLKGAFAAKEQFPEHHVDEEGLLDERATASMLIPGLIDKYGTATAGSMFETFADSMSFQSKLFHEPWMATLEAVGRNLTAEHGTVTPSESFSRFRLATQAMMAGQRYAEMTQQQPQRPQEYAEEATKVQQALSAARDHIMEQELGMSPLGMATLGGVMRDQVTANRIIQEQDKFENLLTYVENPELQPLFNEVVPTYSVGDETTGHSRLLSDFTERAMREAGQEAALIEIKQVLQKPEVPQLLAALGSERASSLFLADIVDKPEPAGRLAELERTMANPDIRAFKEQLSAAGFTGAPEKFLAELLVSRGDEINKTFQLIASDSRLKRIIEQPSQASLPFITCLNSPHLAHFDSNLIRTGISSVVADSYAQASRLSDPEKIQHYVAQTGQFIGDLGIISNNRTVKEHYERFLSNQEELSAKQQARAVRVFKTAHIFGVTELGAAKTLDEVEAVIVDNFMRRLTRQEKTLTNEERTRLVERFGTIAPLLTYTQRYIDQPDYQQALSELVTSVADDSYEVWRRGDGSHESLESMIQAGYLPEQLTLDQYKEWMTDRESSSYETLVSTAQDSADAIQRAIRLGSVDLDMLAPGYSLDIDNLPQVISARNGLGRLTGMLHKAIGQSGGEPMKAEAVDVIATQLGELGDSREVQNLLGMLRNGTDPKEVANYVVNTRQHLEQLGLIIRLAHLTPQEIVQGALLSEADNNEKQSRQQPLDAVIKQLTNDLPEELKFIPQTVHELLQDHAAEHGQSEVFTVEDTIDPQVTIEIGETPQRSCQHYETGGYNQGLIGYFGPEVKITIVRNASGNIIARTITRLMQDEQGKPVLFTEPIYQSVASPRVGELVQSHLVQKARTMGVPLMGRTAAEVQRGRGAELRVRALKMPATYSDSAVGVKRGSLTISA